MKSLLSNKYAPVTFSFGFLEKPVLQLADFQTQWDRMNGADGEQELFSADLPTAIQALEPLNIRKALFISTQSSWTAVFNSCIGVSRPAPQISYPARKLGCRGLLITCIEDTFDTKTGNGVYGGVEFEIFSENSVALYESDRNVAALHDTSGWVFQQAGTPKEFEDTAAYKRRRVRDRLTDDLLESYCAALGIKLFDPEFYGPECALVHRSKGVLPPTFKSVKYRDFAEEWDRAWRHSTVGDTVAKPTELP
jgi:hypothetical protein